MRFFSPMSVNPHPGGFAQRRISELPSVTAPQMREIQRVAQEDFGVDILQIIENAGRAGARLALGMLGGKGRGQRIVVLAGGGNKGAAGLCMARTLVNWGFVVDPVLAEVQGEMAYVARRQVQILTDSYKDESPSFAPNSRMILIATETGGRGVLSAVSTDGRIKQRLSIPAGDVREPAWGPYLR